MASTRLDDEDVGQRLTHFAELLDVVEQVPGPAAESAMEAVQTLAEIYGEALSRVVDLATPEVRRQLAGDELISHLLALHEIHPDSVHTRVEQVLDELRPQIESQGGHLELLQIDDGVARVRLSGGGGGCTSCSSSADPLEEAVSESILALAPELAQVEPVADPGGDGSVLIPVESLLQRKPVAGGRP